jgi:elongation factor P
MIAASELRTGTVIRFQGWPCRVSAATENGGIVRAPLTNLSTGAFVRQRFPGDLPLEELSVERRAMAYLYEAADQSWFMDNQTFEQIGLPTSLLGKRRPFLHEGMTLLVEFMDGRPISVAFQQVIEVRIASTFRPDHYQSARKRAIIENGVEVTVPLFLESGDTFLLYVDLLTCISPRKPGDK